MKDESEIGAMVLAAVFTYGAIAGVIAGFILGAVSCALF
jgi:hypothetical protein